VSNNVQGTVFGDLDDERVLAKIDFSEFEEAFKLESKAISLPGAVALSGKPAEAVLTKSRSQQTLLDTNRHRNLVIAQRRIGISIDEVTAALNKFDVSVINSEKAEILRDDFAPTPEEVALLNDHHSSGKKMAEIDLFLYQLSRIPRFKERLTLIIGLEACSETLSSVPPQTEAVIAASDALMSSKKLKQILEVVLAFGNYINSGRRGGVYGFKLGTLDRLGDMKTRNKERILLHWIVQVVETDFPDALSFMSELIAVPRAAAVSLVSLESDLMQLKRAIDAVEKELEADATNPVLVNFMKVTAPRIKNAVKDLGEAQTLYRKVVAFYSEEANTEPSHFFTTFKRFGENFEQARKDLEKNKKQQEMKANAEQQKLEKRAKTQFRGTGRQISSTDGPEARHEVGDGAIDEIITEMKALAFRRADLTLPKRDKREIGQIQEESGGNSYAASRPWLK
jgi:hypothetical protein